MPASSAEAALDDQPRAGLPRVAEALRWRADCVFLGPRSQDKRLRAIPASKRLEGCRGERALFGRARAAARHGPTEPGSRVDAALIITRSGHHRWAKVRLAD